MLIHRKICSRAFESFLPTCPKFGGILADRCGLSRGLRKLIVEAECPDISYTEINDSVFCLQLKIITTKTEAIEIK